MNTKEKVQHLVEQRKMLAIKNQVSQKMISIAKNLGQPVMVTSFFDNSLPTADEDGVMFEGMRQIQEDDDWTEHEIGYYFNGLKCGINLCISCMTYDSKIVEIKATYNGYIIYAEIEGELKAYAPFPAWEDRLNMFYEGAIEKEKKTQQRNQEVRLVEQRDKLSKFWNGFKRLWGY